MNRDWAFWSLLINGASMLVYPIIWVIWRNVREVRENELHAISTELKEIKALLINHLQWHSEHS